jgi:hypothetical protein
MRETRNNNGKILESEVVDNTTCFAEHEKHDIMCNHGDCRYWHKNEGCNNCILISSSRGPKTLQEIGDIFGITRMRICQIEKIIIKRLVNHKSLSDEIDP